MFPSPPDNSDARSNFQNHFYRSWGCFVGLLKWPLRNTSQNSNSSPPNSIWPRPESKALKSLLWFKVAFPSSETAGIKTHLHSYRGLSPNSLPVTHHWHRIKPSSAKRLIIFWDWVTSNFNPVIFGKQRAKVSWMSGVSRGGPRSLVSSVLGRKDQDSICTHAPCLLPLGSKHSSVGNINMQRKQTSPERWKVQSVIIKVGKQDWVLYLTLRWTLCCAKLPQLCPTLCSPMDCSPPGSSVHGILQARILEWIAKSSPAVSSPPRDRTCCSYVSCIGRWVLYH